MNNRNVITAEQAEALGFTVDRHVNPWFAYKGPRFRPTESIAVGTPSWPVESAPDGAEAGAVTLTAGRVAMTLSEALRVVSEAAQAYIDGYGENYVDMLKAIAQSRVAQDQYAEWLSLRRE